MRELKKIIDTMGAQVKGLQLEIAEKNHIIVSNACPCLRSQGKSGSHISGGCRPETGYSAQQPKCAESDLLEPLYRPRSCQLTQDVRTRLDKAPEKLSKASSIGSRMRRRDRQSSGWIQSVLSVVGLQLRDDKWGALPKNVTWWNAETKHGVPILK